MRITQEADYAARIVRVIAAHTNDKIGSAEVSEEAGIPHRFTFKILRKLTHAGITESIRGKGGGYRLAKEVSTISLLDIFEIIDGPMRINKCLEPDYTCTMCPDASCSLHNKLSEIGENLRSELAKVSFSQFV